MSRKVQSPKNILGSTIKLPQTRHREFHPRPVLTQPAIMHLIRRAAFRAASSSPSTSFARSINTSSPFVLRSKAQSVFAPSVFKRFNSDEASKEKSSIESADGEHGSIRSAIDSASESASTYASEATEKVTEAAEYARDSVADVATGAAAAVGYPPRDYQRNDNRQPYNGGRSGGNGNSRSFGGDRGGRDGGYGGDRGRAPQSFDRSAPPDRVLTPTNSVYVGNLLFDVADSDLRREFSQFGDIKSVIIATDARGLSKGFGYVEFESIDQATAAIEAKHQTVLEGRRLIVNYMNKTQRQNRENPPSKTLFIGNLAFEMSDADLNKLFRDIRSVIDVRVAIDRRTGQPRGFAHADFVDVESAIKGKEALMGKEVYGRTLRVDFSAGPREGRGDGFSANRPPAYGNRDGGDSRGDRGDRF